jgi:hypothetical protein
MGRDFPETPMMDNARNQALSKTKSTPDAPLSPPEVIALINRQKVAAIAQKLLNGNISVIEAARQINAYRGESVGLDESDPDFVTFLAIDSGTDHRLFSESLQNWLPHALARKDGEVARCEEALRRNALGAAARLVARFAEEQPHQGDGT